jgi:hypothetical protein
MDDDDAISVIVVVVMSIFVIINVLLIILNIMMCYRYKHICCNYHQSTIIADIDTTITSIPSPIPSHIPSPLYYDRWRLSSTSSSLIYKYFDFVKNLSSIKNIMFLTKSKT